MKVCTRTTWEVFCPRRLFKYVWLCNPLYLVLYLYLHFFFLFCILFSIFVFSLYHVYFEVLLGYQCIYTVNHKKRDILFLTITLANLNRFLPRSMQYRRGIVMRILSVRHTRALWQNGERSVQIHIPYQRTFISLFWEEEWLVGGDPFYVKFWVNRPPLERNRRFSTNNRS